MRVISVAIVSLFFIATAAAEIEFRDDQNVQYYTGADMNQNPLIGLPDPETDSEPVPFGFLSQQYVAREGDSMTGNLEMQGNNINMEGGEIASLEQINLPAEQRRMNLSGGNLNLNNNELESVRRLYTAEGVENIQYMGDIDLNNNNLLGINAIESDMSLEENYIDELGGLEGKKIDLIRVEGHGFCSEIGHGRESCGARYDDISKSSGIYFNGEEIVDASRGYNLAVIDKNHEVIKAEERYDVHDSDDYDEDYEYYDSERDWETERQAEAERLAEDLENVRANQTVILTTYDQPDLTRIDRLNDTGLPKQLNRVGGSNISFTNREYRDAHVLIGSPHMNPGQAFEQFGGTERSSPDASVLVEFMMVDGVPTVWNRGNAILDAHRGVGADLEFNGHEITNLGSLTASGNIDLGGNDLENVDFMVPEGDELQISGNLDMAGNNMENIEVIETESEELRSDGHFRYDHYYDNPDSSRGGDHYVGKEIECLADDPGGFHLLTGYESGGSDADEVIGEIYGQRSSTHYMSSKVEIVLSSDGSDNNARSTGLEVHTGGDRFADFSLVRLEYDGEEYKALRHSEGNRLSNYCHQMFFTGWVDSSLPDDKLFSVIEADDEDVEDYEELEYNSDKYFLYDGLGIGKDNPSTTLDVNGTVTAEEFETEGEKNFVQAINDTHEAVYVSQESDDARAVIEDSAVLENGEKMIEFPEHFSKVISEEEPEFNVQLTPKSTETHGLSYTMINNTHVKVEELMSGENSIGFDYRISAVRDGFQNRTVVRKQE